MEATNRDRNALEIEKLHAEVNKIIAETAKVNRETHWLPFAIGGTIVGGAAAIGAILAKLF